MAIKRSSGILMPVSSLPSDYGIGTLGKAAYDFIDFLNDAKQSWWQMLPVGPTSYGDSPYQSFSAFAGNPYFIDLDMLCEDGLLKKEDFCSIDFGNDSHRVDYGKLYKNRFGVLRKAFENGASIYKDEFEEFRAENSWLGDYALFMALKYANGMKPWTEWPSALRKREQQALCDACETLKEEIDFHSFVQFLFFRQWNSLKAYAKEQGIGIIGDIPIYVPLDSADVWASPESFRLDEDYVPTEVAGVPPDYFSENGQLWGNPIYDWEAMARDGYGWWIRRIGGAAKLYDIIRIDHFRGIESYWSVPYGEKTARNGCWVKGPGIDFVRRLTGWFCDTQFIAEDLGYLTPGVRQLLADSGLPGMKVLEFAFDTREPSNYLPHTYTENCVCYIGTHDNTPVMSWEHEAAKEDVKAARKYLGLNSREGFNWGFIRGGMSSVASLFVTQMQDYLGLGAESRINTPGTLGANWQWRMDKDAITDKLVKKLAAVTEMYGRSK